MERSDEVRDTGTVLVPFTVVPAVHIHRNNADVELYACAARFSIRTMLDAPFGAAQFRERKAGQVEMEACFKLRSTMFLQ